MNSTRTDGPETSSGRGPFARLARAVRRYPLVFVFGALALGLAGIPIADEADAYFSSNAFCANSCHVMTTTVYEEFKQSTHGSTPSGVVPKCADCHVREQLLPAWWDHVIGTRDLIVFLFEGVRTKAAFEPRRSAAADRVRFKMLERGSGTCLRCHVRDAIKPHRKRGQRQHQDMRERNIPCIACHYNLVHKEVEPSQAFLDATESD